MDVGLVSLSTWTSVCKEVLLLRSIVNRRDKIRFQHRLQKQNGSLRTLCSFLADGQEKKLTMLEYRLKNDVTCAETVAVEFRKYPKSWLEHCKMLFGSCIKVVSQHSALVDVYLERLKERSCNARKTELCTRLQWAIGQHEDWFLVFNTLTVDEENYTHVFSKGSVAWHTYIRRMDRMVAQAAYGSVRNAEGRSYHEYFAVVERGERHGRLHIHALHLCKALPEHVLRDPNYACTAKTNRQITAIKPLWEWGWSMPIAVRSSPRDSYGRRDWAWPNVRSGKKLAAVEIKPPVAVAYYLAKYVSKSYRLKKETHQWRTKMSRSLGTDKLQLIVESLTVKQMETAVVLPSRMLNQVHGLTIPKSLLRKAVAREWLRRTPMTNMLFKLEPALSCIRRFRDLTETRMSSEALTSGMTEFIRTLNSIRTDISDLRRRIEELVLLLWKEPLPFQPARGYTARC